MLGWVHGACGTGIHLPSHVLSLCLLSLSCCRSGVKQIETTALSRRLEGLGHRLKSGTVRVFSVNKLSSLPGDVTIYSTSKLICERANVVCVSFCCAESTPETRASFLYSHHCAASGQHCGNCKDQTVCLTAAHVEQ